MKPIIWIIFLISQTSFSQSVSYRMALQKMQELSGADQLFETSIKGMLDVYRSSSNKSDLNLLDQLEQEFLKEGKEKLYDKLVPIYFKYLTEQDLKDLILFYESPVGQKLALQNPKIMQESMQVGAEWGREIGENLKLKLETEQKKK